MEIRKENNNIRKPFHEEKKKKKRYLEVRYMEKKKLNVV